MFQTFRNLLGERALQTILLFGIFALLGWQIDSPWWDGRLLKIGPVLPEPSGAFVKQTDDNEEVQKEVAQVDLAPTTEQTSDGDNDTSTDDSSTDDTSSDDARPRRRRHPRPDPADYELLDNVRTLESKLTQPPVRLERPCHAWYSPHLSEGIDPVCRSRAMDEFFEQLRRVARKDADRPVRFSQFGDSLIAGDGFTGELRRLLHDQFGDGGFGFVHMGKASQYIGTRHLSTRTSSDWEVTNIINGGPGQARYGFAGVAFAPDGQPTLRVYPHDEGTGRSYDRVGLLYWRPYRDFSIQLTVDGEGRRPDLSGPAERDALTWVDVGDGAHNLVVSDFRSDAVYYGVVLENSGPGAVVDNLGLMNGRAPRLKVLEADTWQTHIDLRGSDVVSFAYGVNSAGPHRPDDEWLDDYSRDYAEILQTVRGAGQDGTDCLVVSALTRGTLNGDKVEVYPSLRPLIRAQREAARSSECAFWHAFDAIGGEQGVDRWYHNDPQLLGSDFSHPTRAGYTKLANLFYASLIEAFRRYLEERIRRASVPNLRDLYADPTGQTPNIPKGRR